MYKFLDKVKITKGFFVGVKGKLIGIKDEGMCKIGYRFFEIQIENPKKIITVPEQYLKITY